MLRDTYARGANFSYVSPDAHGPLSSVKDLRHPIKQHKG